MSKKAKGSKKGQNSKNDEYYTEEEVRRLDALQELTNKKFSDEELYDYMLKYKSNDEIMNELKEELKTRNRGKEYEWNEVGKSKYTNFYIILK
jgi:Zn-finger domain-containing protein